VSTSKNRAVEKDKFKSEKMLLANVPEDKKPELLRFEVRFARQASLEAFLSKVTHEKMKDIPLVRIFDKKLCREVLLASWEKIVGTPTSQLALKMTMPIEEVFDAVIKNLAEKGSAHSLNNALAGLGIYVLINQHGSRNARKKIERNWSTRSWKRLAKKIQAAAVTLKDLPTSHAIQDVHTALLNFERYDWHG
jgi:ADP-heptose:LPS heptosyltransferase